MGQNWINIHGGYKVTFEYKQLDNDKKPKKQHVAELECAAQESIYKQIVIDELTSGILYDFVGEGKDILEYIGNWELVKEEKQE